MKNDKEKKISIHSVSIFFLNYHSDVTQWCQSIDEDVNDISTLLATSEFESRTTT